MAIVAHDLMRNVMVVGNARFARARVTRLETALQKVETGENFYWQTRRGLFYVNLFAYDALDIPRYQVAEQLTWTMKSQPRRYLG
jgi:hypothetical protein